MKGVSVKPRTVTKEQVNAAAMYLFAKQQGIDPRNKKRVQEEWNRWHRCVQSAHRDMVRKVLRALAWAEAIAPSAKVFRSMEELDAAFFPNLDEKEKNQRRVIYPRPKNRKKR